MSEASHLSALEKKHEALDRQLKDEMARPNADAARVLELKRHKLRLKDEMMRLRLSDDSTTVH
jgi:hypothetical protein